MIAARCGRLSPWHGGFLRSHEHEVVVGAKEKYLFILRRRLKKAWPGGVVKFLGHACLVRADMEPFPMTAHIQQDCSQDSAVGLVPHRDAEVFVFPRSELQQRAEASATAPLKYHGHIVAWLLRNAHLKKLGCAVFPAPPLLHRSDLSFARFAPLRGSSLFWVRDIRSNVWSKMRYSQWT